MPTLRLPSILAAVASADSVNSGALINFGSEFKELEVWNAAVAGRKTRSMSKIESFIMTILLKNASDLQVYLIIKGSGVGCVSAMDFMVEFSV